MGIFSRKQPQGPPSNSASGGTGNYRRHLSPPPDLHKIAHDLLAENELAGLLHPDDVIDRIMLLCKETAKRALENTICSYAVFEIDQITSRHDFRPEQFFDFLLNNNVALVAVAHDRVTEMLASEGFREAMAEDLRRLSDVAWSAAEREIRTGVARHEVSDDRGGCDARSWISGRGLLLCGLPPAHPGDHDWFPSAARNHS